MQPDSQHSLDDTQLGEAAAGFESTVHSSRVSVADAPRASVAPPERVGRYLVIEEIGSGTMGTVHAAYDPQLDRKIALKLVRPERGADREFCARMLREAQALAKLSHPNVVAVYDAGTLGEQVFIAMDFIRGTTLRQWLAARRPWREVLDMFLQAGRGLAAAHEVGLVHRDFKPDNVLVGDDGRARVVDFGLAAETEAPVAHPSLTVSGERWQMAQGSLTHHGALVGTPAYMSPEQLMGQPAQMASDQFSFCVALFEGLYGERPFRGASLDALTDAILRGRISDAPRGSRVPVRIRRVLARGLTAQPGARHADMRGLLAELERAAARPWRQRAALVAVALAVTVGFVVRGVVQHQEDIEARLAALAAARGEACGGAESQLAGFWDPVRAQAVARAFAATGLEFAAHDATQATALLDRHAAGWSAAHRELCLAHQRGDLPDNLHERGLACLYERRAALGSLVDVLEQADRAVVERSSEAISGLRGFAGCTDPARLLRDGASAVAPEQAQAYARLRQEIAQISSQAELRSDEALRLRFAPVLEAARATGDPGLQGRALRLRAELESDAGDSAAALAGLREAWRIALAGAADLEAMQAAQDLATEFARRMRADEAEGWLHNGRALLARLGGGDDEDIWRMTEVEGIIAQTRGQPAASIAILEPLLARIAAARGDANPQHIRIQINVASAYEQLGDYQRSLENLRRALRSREALHGTEHPALLVPLENMGVSLDNLGQFAEAQANYRRALDLVRRFRANTPMRAAFLHNNLGESLYREERYDEALREFDAAREVARGVEPQEDPLVGIVEIGRGNALLRLGRLDEATAAYVAGEAALGGLAAEHPAHAYTRVGLARIALARGRIGEATRLVDEASALRKPDNSPPPERAELALLRAELQWASPATRALARASAQEAAALYRQAGPGFLRPLAEAEAWLAARPSP